MNLVQLGVFKVVRKTLTSKPYKQFPKINPFRKFPGLKQTSLSFDRYFINFTGAFR